MAKIKKIAVLLLVLFCFQAANAEWVKQQTRSFAWLRDISFQSESKGWIVGTDGTILSTDDGGATWQPMPKFTTDTFRQIYFTDEFTGWLLAERNVYSRGQNGTSYVLKTTNGGRSWERLEFEAAGRERVTRLLFNKLGWGMAYGEGGIFYKLQEDGKTWKKSLTAIHFLLLGGAFSDGEIGALAGAGGTLMFTENNGLTWDRATIIGDNDARLNAVVFAGQKLGWAVGSGGVILASTGGGRLWRAQQSGTTNNLNDVYFLNQREGWAVGDEGTIIRTQNGGASWSEVNSRVTHRLEKVCFNGKRGFAVGFGGTLLKYVDGASNDTTGKPGMKQRN